MARTYRDEPVISQDGDDIVVDFVEGSDDAPEESGHDENLAEKIEDSELGQRIVEMVETDKENRADWEKRLKDGLEIIGVDDIPSEAVAFEGAASVTHPALAQAMVRFQANAMEEIFPAEGPVKTKVIGRSTPEREDQAIRVKDYMNHLLTDEDDEYFEQTDQMMMYLPYAGSAFRKIYSDITEERALSRAIPGQYFIVPYDATSLRRAPRYTHWYKMSGNELNERIDSGEFAVPENIDPSGSTQDQQDRELQDISDDRQETRFEDDVIYDIYEVHIEIDIGVDKPGGSEEFPVAPPYVITIEKDSGSILGARRLWEEGDTKRRKRVHFVHYKFLPGLGFYGWGYLHIIGALGKAASGALRALLDGAATASLQGGFKSKEAKIAGEFVFTPGEWKDVDMTAEELAKSFYTPPFKEPSPALFKTLELLVLGIQEFSSTTEAMTGTADNRGPVGTTLALIEQGSKVYSGIHKRLHKAARMEFKLFAQLNFESMDEDATYPYDVAGGDNVSMYDDFDARVDVLPVSDPNIYSNVQRIAQAQGALELKNDDPDLYDEEARRELHLDMHRALRTPNPERLLPRKRLRRLDPVTENQSILTGGAVKAFVEQDHAAHMKTHQMFLMEIEGMGLEPQIVEAVKLNLMAHLAEHYAHAYRLRIEQELGAPLPDTDFTDSRDEEDIPIEIDNAVARAVATNVSPPPPPQGPEDEMTREQQKHEQKLAHSEEDHRQRLQHEEEKHEQELRHGAQEHDKDMKKKAAENVLDTASRAAKLQE